jgi:DNA repair protein RecO (recombination protein O)
MKFVKTKGIVLHQIPTGDADKVVTYLTPDKGKINVIAPGAKRTRSSIAGCTEFLCYSEIDLFKTKDHYRLRDGKILEPFYEIRNDLLKLAIATYFCEVLKDIVMEDFSAKEELRLFLNSLYYLSKEKKDKDLIIAVFMLKLLCLNGLAPCVSHCILCNKQVGKENLGNLFFSFSYCGIVCVKCVKDSADRKILPGTFYLLNHIVSSKLDDLFKFEIVPDVLKEVVSVSERFLQERLEKKFKTLDFLKKINSL